MPNVRRALAAVALALVAGPALAVLPAPAGAAPLARYVDRIFGSVAVDREVAYGSAIDEFGARQVLHADVYTPVGDTFRTRPAIVLAHGGGFVSGNKRTMATLATGLARRGFVAVSIEYRLDEDGDGLTWPPSGVEKIRIREAKHDMQGAVRWLRSKASTYGVDPQRVAAGGYSAGAIMAIHAATTADDPGASGTPGVSSTICTAVALAGSGDVADIDAGDVGALFLHGADDITIRPSAPQRTYDAMVAAGLPAELVWFPDTGHNLNAHADEIEQRASEWLVDHVVEPESGCVGPAVPANASFVQAAHQDLLGRTATADEVVQHGGYLDTGGSKSLLLRTLTTSDEWLGAIVTGFYTDTLGRQPDAEGLAWWVGGLRKGLFTVAQVAASFYASPEYRAGRVDAWIADLYQAILDRPASRSDITYWAQQVARRSPSWVAVQLYGSLESRQARVRSLYQLLLGRAPEPSGLDYWARRVATTGDLALARELAGSPEYTARAVSRYP